jgi:hypothetical protein
MVEALMVAALRLQLWKAATEGNTAEVVHLVEAGADIHSRAQAARAGAGARDGGGPEVIGVAAHASWLSNGGCLRPG